MLLKELCCFSGLGKKAVDYYVDQGIVQPEVLANGYRDFSEEDARRLRKVAVLRKLGLGLEDIRRILADGAKAESLHRAAAKRRGNAEWAAKQAELLDRLAEGADWVEIALEAEAAERQRSIGSRLRQIFPGYYGKFLASHFAAFLQAPICSHEEQRAFEEVVQFLDACPSPDLSPELLSYLDMATAGLNDELMVAQTQNMRRAMADGGKYLEENKEALDAYMSYRDSEAYRNSPAAAIKEQLIAFQSNSGYYQVFIPAMRRLSPAYDAYQRDMEKVNEAFLQMYPAMRDGE